jgi:hypothetical protein
MFNASNSLQLADATQALRDFVGATYVSDNNNEIDRITMYHLYWSYYMGKHWKDHNETMVTLNYCRAFVDKINMFLLGKEACSFKVVSYESDTIDKSIESLAEQFISRNWKLNELELFTYELLQMGGVMGDAFVIAEWCPIKYYVKYKIADSRYSYPEFSGLDKNDIDVFTLRQPLPPNGKSGYRLKITRFTKATVESWYQKDTSFAPTNSQSSVANSMSKNDERGVRYEYTISNNILGIIPVVHIKNKPSATNNYGTSDLNDVLKLNKIYNELNQQIKKIIDYHAFPTTIIFGATMKNLVRGIGKVWSGLPLESRIETLKLDANLGEIKEMVSLLKMGLHEMSNVPESVLGKVQTVSHTSASALRMLYHPVIQEADVKGIIYGKGIAALNHLAFYITRKYIEHNLAPKNVVLQQLDEISQSAYSSTFEENFKIMPVFKYGFPTDEMLELQKAQLGLSMGMTSKHRTLNNLGVKNVPELMKEWEEEKLSESKVLAEVEAQRTTVVAQAQAQVQAQSMREMIKTQMEEMLKQQQASIPIQAQAQKVQQDIALEGQVKQMQVQQAQQAEGQ